MARIAIGGFQHETNTFSDTLATLDDFLEGGGWPGLQSGEAMLEGLHEMNLPISGAIAAILAAGHEPVPLIWSAATPSGRVKKEAFDHVLKLFLEELRHCGQIDALYLDLHGAMATTSTDDGEGDFLRAIRAQVGNLPLAASLDLHANVSLTMFDSCDLMVSYRTYPHVDMSATGARTADALIRSIECRSFPHRHLIRLDSIMPLTSQCTLIEPAASLYSQLEILEQTHDVLLSLTLGFALADVPDCGPAIFAYGADADAVKLAADELHSAFIESVSKFDVRTWSADDAVKHAIILTNEGKFPVVLADTQDNPGGGGQMDTTGILQTLIAYDVQDAVVAMIYDPDVATLAHEVGPGAILDISLGGKLPGAGSGSAKGQYIVDHISDANFVGTGPMWGGVCIRLGKMAVLRTGRTGGVRVIVASRKMQAGDQSILTHMGIIPTECKIIVLKSSVHFRADFDRIADTTLIVSSPGTVAACLKELQYYKLRPGMRILSC